jgi:glycosyltransferase involved in cell wall biosynthesis
MDRIFSYNTLPDNYNLNRGYAIAGYNMVMSIKKLGHSIYDSSPIPKVQINFSQPDWFEIRPNQYQIGFTPWESTELPKGWAKDFNRCNQVWTPSPWIADVYKQNGVDVPIHVYEHGISKDWKPIMRRPRGPIKFLSVGEPAVRKNSQMTLDAFREVFKDDPRQATLTIKAFTRSSVRWYRNGSVQDPNDLPNVRVVTQDVTPAQMVQIYNAHDVNVYPSYGEGFGFIPLQSLASGMPTICTEAWAPYKQFLGPLALDSDVIDSPWPDEHPGLVFKPDYENLVSLIRTAHDEFPALAKYYFNQSFAIHKHYDWLSLTKDILENIPLV